VIGSEIGYHVLAAAQDKAPINWFDRGFAPALIFSVATAVKDCGSINTLAD
jgi:hypothetical protein